ncbi:MAG: PaaI family thioesterase [Alphaproteobacteria bacterium]|nr:PaaI family thioesterase [Alphaproteobacteria bacterium]TAD91895.1 MAG: PaaI family thioesterase [Alphaproteobacteria bacterium]
MSPKLDVDAFNTIVREELPFAHAVGITALSLSATGAVVLLPFDDQHLRPGGTISGPSIFCLADVCMYAAVLAALGPVKQAVTTNLTIDFLRRPEPGPLTAEGTILKLGRRLAVIRVDVLDASRILVAHATGTYSIPTARG